MKMEERHKWLEWVLLTSIPLRRYAPDETPIGIASGCLVNYRYRRFILTAAQAVEYVKRNGRITNSKYQEIIGVTRKTAARDLNGLVELGVFDLLGSKRGAHYVVAKKK